MTVSLLKEGDIIDLLPGHTIFTQIPEHCVAANRIGCFGKLTQGLVTIGDPIGGLDTAFYAGCYVVTRVAFDGGGTGMGPHDVYPNGHHVWCEKIVEKWHHEIHVDFYQSGCFTAMIENITPVGRATVKWSIDDKEGMGENR